MLSEEKRLLLERSFERSELLQFFRAELETVEKGKLSIRVPKQKIMTRRNGIFNGAIIASLVDASSGYAAVSHYEDDAYVVTVELKVNYLRPAAGEFLLSKSEVLKGGKRICTVRTDVFAVSVDGDELHAATALVTMMRIK